MKAEAEVKITNNAEIAEKEFAAALHRALVAIGMTAETYAKSDPDMPVVTGRARNSITFAVAGYEANDKTYQADKAGPGETAPYQGEYNGEMKGKRDEFVAIGSNVKYFPLIENGSSKRRAHHVLKRAATEHSDEYKEIVRDSMKNA